MVHNVGLLISYDFKDLSFASAYPLQRIETDSLIMLSKNWYFSILHLFLI